MENLFSVKQAAYILKVHPLTVRRYINEGRLKAIKAGGNVRIKESELQDFNKDFSPQPQTGQKQTVKQKFQSAKIFTEDDPFFRLRGRGASINLS